MEKLEHNLIKKFMKKLNQKTQICLNKVYTKHNPQTISQLVKLVQLCLKDSGGMTDPFYNKLISEIAKNKAGKIKKSFRMVLFLNLQISLS